MAKCDLCGERCNLSDMTSLLSQYQVNGIVDICPSCRKYADKQKAKLLSDIPQQMRDFIANKKHSTKCNKKRYDIFWFLK